MNLLPVLDLMHRQIVHGVAGERARYRPIVSQIAADSAPATVALAIQKYYGCDEFYLADLDAIGGAAPQWDVYRQLLALGLQLVIDAGTGTIPRVSDLASFADMHSAVTGIVIGLESIAPDISLAELHRCAGPDRSVFSLDLKSGQPLLARPDWSALTPLQLVGRAASAGFRRLLVLDLAAVGVGQGPPTGPLCRAIHRAHPELEIWSGGGVRSRTDLASLADAGCQRVLVASALHQGTWLVPPAAC
ncbi:MAG: HisA/HisF-related TIM barrel protein [Pirellulaceae bacterium]